MAAAMRPEDLAGRLHQQAVAVLALVSSLPHRVEWQATFAQVCRSAPSASDNYRSACRSRSRKEFVSRLAVAADEADETVGWLQIMHDTAIGPREEVAPMLEEAMELRAILAKSCRTSRENLKLLEAREQLERRRRRKNI